MIRPVKWCGFLCLFTILLTACDGTPTPDFNQVNTSVALTVAAAQAAAPSQTPAATQEIPAAPTNTTQPVQAPTLTPIPLSTPIPPAPTATIDTCYRADWVQDVTIPDGSIITPGTKFTKTWRIQNTGSCTWTTTYAIVFDGGYSTGAPPVTPLASTVPPGGTADLSVEITAPASEGEYTWEFKLRGDTGRIFGFGSGYLYPITAEIKVKAAPVVVEEEETLIYDLASAYCTASWKSIFGPLSCPGGTSDSNGFVVRDDNPKLQDGDKYNGSALFTHPAWTDDGVIRGDYPAIQIHDDYHFRAILGCGYGGNACDVRFALSYKAGADPWVELGSWLVDYSDDPREIDLDLSFLDGKNVQFGLVVAAHGTSAQDWARWVAPRVVILE